MRTTAAANDGRPHFSAEDSMNKIQALTLILGAAATGAAQSATTTTSFQVTASLQSVCTATAAALNFGAYTPGAGVVKGQTTVTVNCTKNTPFTVLLNGGSGGGTVAQRLMQNGTNHLQYNLFIDQALGTIFGDGSGSGGSKTVGGTGAGTATANAVQVPVYGQVPDSAINQVVLPGSYADTITVTVSY
jgi:spore coat protein U-like protein